MVRLSQPDQPRRIEQTEVFSKNASNLGNDGADLTAQSVRAADDVLDLGIERADIDRLRIFLLHIVETDRPPSASISALGTSLLMCGISSGW